PRPRARAARLGPAAATAGSAHQPGSARPHPPRSRPRAPRVAGMREDGRAVRVGIFLVPSAENPRELIRAVEEAERAGLELVGIQDHPYQRRFFDTWTLLSYLAARTERITLVPDVVNLPLRPPAVLAKAAASLDVLSGGG